MSAFSSNSLEEATPGFGIPQGDSSVLVFFCATHLVPQTNCGSKIPNNQSVIDLREYATEKRMCRMRYVYSSFREVYSHVQCFTRDCNTCDYSSLLFPTYPADLLLAALSSLINFIVKSRN
jgi:hypothetical protein